MKSTTGSFNESDLITSALLIEIFRADNTAYSKKLNKVIMMRDGKGAAGFVPRPPFRFKGISRRDRSSLRGPVAADFHRAPCGPPKLFMDTWTKQQGEPLAQKNYFPKLDKKGDEVVRALAGAAEDPHSRIFLTLLSAIDNAEQQVHLTNAYFAPDPQLLKTLIGAAQRGVEVKLVLPSHTDSWAVFHAGRSHFSRLLRAGVKIYERRGAVMHSKTASIDGVWSTIGSTNLDWRSRLHNDELNAAILGRDFSRQMDTMFARDLAESDAIELDRWQRRSPLLKLKEWAARRLEYWL